MANTDRYIAIEEFRSKYSHFAVEAGDIVVASSGNTYGKVGRIRRQHLPVMMNTSVIRFHSGDRSRLHDDYLYAFLRSSFFKNQVEQFVIGSAQPNFGPSHVRRMKLALPPIDVQVSIASILSAYDDLIENNTRRIGILEEMARRLYEEWFVHFRFPGCKTMRFFDTEMGPVPEGWRVQPVSGIVEFDPPTPVPRDGLKPFIPMAGLSTRSMLIGEIEMRSGNGGSKFRNSDTLFARITPCLENGKTAFVNFLPNADAIAFGSTEFIVMRGQSVCPQYVYCLARSPEFREHAIKSMSGATGRQRVQNRCFDNFLVAAPDSATNARFEMIADPIFVLIRNLADANKNLQATREMLLPKLISGEIDVTTAPIPAAVAAA